MPQIHFRKLDLQSLIVGCQNEATRSLQARPLEDEGYCFELFRRAIEKRDAAAWDAIHQQYRRMVVLWIGPQHDGSDDLVNETFVKFWRSCSDRNFSRHFSHVGQVLKYLKRCAVSVRLDQYRRQQREHLWTASEDERQGQMDSRVEEMALDDIVRQQRKTQMEVRLRDDQERLVVYLSFELGLSPSEIARRQPSDFADIEEVRRVKERVVKRLKGDAELRQWLE